jgi:alkyl sulfatase BDS1-like metallo-beta-lactamase superfamily hydrolase
MATVDECEAAMRKFAGILGGMDDDTRRKLDFERSVTCHFNDIDTTFAARLRDGTLQDIARTDSRDAQIKLTMASDTLLDMVDGKISFPAAWAKGRVKISAGFRDLLLLRKLIA